MAPIFFGFKPANFKVTHDINNRRFALKADGGASELKQSTIRWKLYARFLLVALLALLLRSAVLVLLVGNWHWQPQTAILVAILMATAVFHLGAVFLYIFNPMRVKTLQFAGQWSRSAF